jgi:hypothetical protein
LGLKREALQVLFGAIGYALAIQFGFIKPQGPFWDNVLWGVVVMVGSRFMAFMFGGKK